MNPMDSKMRVKRLGCGLTELNTNAEHKLPIVGDVLDIRPFNCYSCLFLLENKYTCIIIFKFSITN